MFHWKKQPPQGSALCIRIVMIFTMILIQSAILQSEVVIDKLPYTIENVSGKTFVLSGSLTSATDGIHIGDNVHDILLNLGSDTITFGIAGGDNNYGIGLYWNPYNVEIRGGWIIHGGDVSVGNAEGNNCIFLGNSHDIFFNNVSASVDGIDGKCLSNNGTTYNLEIAGGSFASNSTAFTSRCTTTGAVICFSPQKILPGESDYHINIHDIEIGNGPHTGISILKGSGTRCLAYIHNNSISIDAVNDLYPDSDGNTCHSSGNAHCIEIYGLQAGSKIYDNILRSGNQREGSQGILLQDCKGTTDQPVEVYGNDIDVSNGPNRPSPSGKVCGLYWRYVPGEVGTWNCYNHIYDNRFKLTVDTDTNTTHIGRLAEGVSVYFYDSCAHNIFENNHVEVVSLSDTGFIEVAAIGLGLRDTTESICAGAVDNIFRYNYYKAPRNPVAFGNSRGEPGNNFVLYRDTIDCLHSGPDSTTIVFDQTGTWWKHSTGNRLIDCVFLNQANDADVVFSYQPEDGTDGLGEDLRFERTLKVWVRGYNNLPVVDALVTAVNNYGDTVFVGNTGLGGLAAGVVTYKYFARDPIENDDIILKDSTGYNDFSLITSRDGDISMTSLKIDADCAADTLTLQNTFGSGSWSAGGEEECQEPATIPSLIYPINGSPAGQKPTLCVHNSYPGNCPVPLTYDFQVALDADMNAIVAESYNVCENDYITTYTLSGELETGQYYYWRSRSHNGSAYSGWSAAEEFIIADLQCGDINSDGSINVADAVYIVNYIFLGGDAPDPFESGDTNCDTYVNIIDTVILINYIFVEGNLPCDIDVDGIPDC
jgi:hypothetical protein